MTVAELIELLKTQPADLEVLVASYEEGLDPVTDVKVTAISKHKDRPWYVGIYEEVPVSHHKALLIKSRYLRSESEKES